MNPDCHVPQAYSLKRQHLNQHMRGVFSAVLIHKLSLNKTLHDCMEECERKAWFKKQGKSKERNSHFQRTTCISDTEGLKLTYYDV